MATLSPTLQLSMCETRGIAVSSPGGRIRITRVWVRDCDIGLVPCVVAMSIALSREAGGGGERGKLLQFARECVQQARENESWGLFLEAVEELQK